MSVVQTPRYRASVASDVGFIEIHLSSKKKKTLTFRASGSGDVASMTPNQARRIADWLQDAADKIDKKKGQR